MRDVGLPDNVSRERIAGPKCGNGVEINHGRETQYCHLKQDRILVTVGEHVGGAIQLGLIGLSGQTEFSHVHFAVRHEGQVIDPFTGRSNTAGCGVPHRSLWRDPSLSYEDVALYYISFASAEP